MGSGRDTANYRGKLDYNREDLKKEREVEQEPNDAGRPKLLIVCEGNTCRSVMAEALARRWLGDTVDVSSAGLRPQPASDAKTAIETLKTHFEIDASSHIPRSVTDLQLDDFDYVVAVEKRVAKRLKRLFSLPPERLIVWNIPDPWGDDVLEYQNSASMRYRNLRRFSKSVSPNIWLETGLGPASGFQMG